MSRDGTLKIIAWSLVAVTSTLAAGCIGLELFGSPTLAGSVDPEAGSGGLALVTVQSVVGAAFAALGAIIVARQPRNPVGWLLELIGLSFVSIGISNGVYVHVVLPEGHAPGLVAVVVWLGNWCFIPAFLPVFTLLPLLFPTGRPMSPRWRPLLFGALLGGALLTCDSALRAGPMEGAPAVANPLGVDHPVVELAGLAGLLITAPVAVASIGSLVLRFRRSAGAERLQLKWVAWAAVSLVPAFAAAWVGGDLGWPVMLLALLTVAAAMAVAMLRYRLYDIDVVINRTLVYVTLTASLAGAYVIGVLLLRLVLDPLTKDSPLAVAGSTLVVAALFRPARASIQRWVDRRFYRGRYDAAKTLAAFSARLRDELDLGALVADLRVVVRETVQPAHVSLWLRETR